MESPPIDFWARAIEAYFEENQQVSLGDRTAICLRVTPEITYSDGDPVTCAQPEVQDL